MTETTTKEHVDEENLVDAAERAAAEAGAKSLATIEPDQQRFNENQIAILRQLGIEDATQGDLDLFFHYCRTTGLDPFRRQIYMIGRNTKLTEWVDQGGRREKVEKWVTKYTIQTGIDGYRRNGREAAKMLGDSLSFEGPFWCGDDGEWRDVWTSKSAPFAAKFTIYRNGEPFTGIAHFDEFVQTNNIYEGSGRDRRVTGEEPNSMWRKMPRNQIAKCAEALAWRRAYPDDFSGLILEDAAQPTVIDQDGNIESEPAKTEPKTRPGGRGTDGLRARAQAAQQKRDEVIDAETDDEAATQVTQEEAPPGVGDTEQADTKVENTTADSGQGSDLRKSMRKKLNDNIFAIFGELSLNGDEKRDDRLVVIRAALGDQSIQSTKELTDDQLQDLRNDLNTRKKAKTLDADVTEWINADDLRREGIDPDATPTDTDAQPGDGK